MATSSNNDLPAYVDAPLPAYVAPEPTQALPAYTAPSGPPDASELPKPPSHVPSWLQTGWDESLGALDAAQSVITGLPRALTGIPEAVNNLPVPVMRDVGELLDRAGAPAVGATVASMAQPAVPGLDKLLNDVHWSNVLGKTYTDIGARDKAAVNKWAGGSGENEAVYGATGSHTLGDLSQAATIIAPMLIGDVPGVGSVGDVMTKYVSDPLKQAVHDATIRTMAKTEIGRSVISGHRMEDRIWKGEGREQAVAAKLDALHKQVRDLNPTPEDRISAAAHQEDPSVPMTEKGAQIHAIYKPVMDWLKWEPGYLHRVLVKSSRGITHLLKPTASDDVIGNQFASALSEPSEHAREYYGLVPDEAPEPIAPEPKKSPPAKPPKPAPGMTRLYNSGVGSQDLWTTDIKRAKGYPGWKTRGEYMDVPDAQAEKMSIRNPDVNTRTKAMGHQGVPSKDYLVEDKNLRASAKPYHAPLRSDAQTLERLTQLMKFSGEPETIILREESAPETLVAHVAHTEGEPGLKVTGYKNHQTFEVGHLEPGTPIVGAKVTGPHGERWTITEATIPQIEKHANVVYTHDLGVSVDEAAHAHIRATELQKALDEIKTDPMYYNTVRPEPDVMPKGWRKINVPELRGFVAPNRVAKVLEHALKGPEIGPKARALNAAMFRINFATGPFWHLFNLGDIGISESAGRGINFARPFGLIGDTGKAFSQVVGAGDDYLKLQRDGMGFMHLRAVEPKIRRSLLSSVMREVDGPYMRKAAADGLIDPKDLQYIGDGMKGMIRNGIRHLGNISEAWESQPTWIGNDSTIMHAVYAEMGRNGGDLLKAGRKIRKHFPQYRMRMSRPGLDDALAWAQKTGLVWFMPYHLDILRIMGGRLRDAATLDPEAIRSLMAQAVMYSVVYPQIDSLVQSHYGVKARIERFGVDKVPEAFGAVIKHQEAVNHLIHLFVTPSIGGYTAQYFMDPPFQEKKKSIAAQLADDVTYNLGSLYPLQSVSTQKSVKDNALDAALSQLGVEGIPKPKKKDAETSSSERPY